MAKFNPFPEPKRGKARAVLERPAAMKTKKWNKTKYTRERSEVGPEGLRMDRTAWTRSLADLLTASDADIGGILLEDGLLVEARQDMLSMWPRPFVQSLCYPKWGSAQASMPCKALSCLHQPSPSSSLVVGGTGASTTILHVSCGHSSSAQHQSQDHWGHGEAPVPPSRRMGGCKREVDWLRCWETLGRRGRWWDNLRSKGHGELASDLTTPIPWEQWCGIIVKRGNPSTLFLCRLAPKESGQRAPGPGAIRKVEWAPLASKWLKDKKLILHTDAAKSYRCKVRGLLHDNVVHCKKRVKVNGKWRWKRPTFVRLVTHAIPGTKREITVKAWQSLESLERKNQHQPGL